MADSELDGRWRGGIGGGPFVYLTTQFIQAKLERTDGLPTVHPLQQKSRLQTMARKDALICIPEGTEVLPEGATVDVQVLDDQVFRCWPGKVT